MSYVTATGKEQALGTCKSWGIVRDTEKHNEGKLLNVCEKSEYFAAKGILKLRKIKQTLNPLLNNVHTLRFLRHHAPKVIIYCTQTAPKLRPQHVRQILLRATFLLGIVSFCLYRKQDNRGITVPAALGW